jgi:hypothetical protein
VLTLPDLVSATASSSPNSAKPGPLGPPLLASRGPESAQGMGIVILFPLAFVSNALLPTTDMPTILRVIADWNP